MKLNYLKCPWCYVEMPRQFMDRGADTYGWMWVAGPGCGIVGECDVKFSASGEIVTLIVARSDESLVYKAIHRCQAFVAAKLEQERLALISPDLT